MQGTASLSEALPTEVLAPTSSSGISPALVSESEKILAHHGRSFWLASLFVPKEARADAAVVYAFCRLADDSVDEAPDTATATRRLEILENELTGNSTPRPVVAGALDVFRKRGIPLHAAQDLLAGMRSDLAPRIRIHNDDELLLYCYRAAGTVGHMMRGIVGASDSSAEEPAVSLGIAMQLTNICRDVAEDAGRDRVYLPATRMAQRSGDTFAVVKDLLALAETYYLRAERGMRFIPWQARVAVWIAARLYRAIGVRVAARGPAALRSRTVVSLGRKLWIVAGAAVAALTCPLFVQEKD